MPRRALRVFLDPVFWLGVQCAAAFALLAREGRLDPVRVLDTHSYEVLLEARSWTELLSFGRTLGYPAFLGTIGRLGEDYALVPEAQALLYLGAALLFGWAVRAYTGSGWLGFAAATPVIWARQVSMVNGLQSDLVAVALATASLAFLLLVVKSPLRAGPWVGLTLSVLAAYHVRPVYVTLLALVPLLAPLLSWFLRPYPRAWRRGLIPGVLLALLLPYVFYCGLRLAVVGHFGLVSFGGVNAIGVTAGFLDEDLIEELPDRMRPLAAEILEGRIRIGVPALKTLPGGGWESKAIYNGTVWRVAYPAVVRQIEEEQKRAEQRQARRRRKEARRERRQQLPSSAGETMKPKSSSPVGDPQAEPETELAGVVKHSVEANRRLSELSREIVRRRPARFLRWIRDGSTVVVTRLVRRPRIFWPGLALVLTIPLAVVRGRSASADAADRAGPIIGVIFLAVGYFAVSLLAVVAVEIPLDRFVMPMTFLLPSALAVQLFELWRRILGLDESDAGLSRR